VHKRLWGRLLLKHQLCVVTYIVWGNKATVFAQLFWELFGLMCRVFEDFSVAAKQIKLADWAFACVTYSSVIPLRLTKQGVIAGTPWMCENTVSFSNTFARSIVINGPVNWPAFRTWIGGERKDMYRNATSMSRTFKYPLVLALFHLAIELSLNRVAPCDYVVDTCCWLTSPDTRTYRRYTW
jgi:hypothetical protein